MAKEQRRLGRGLSSLISSTFLPAVEPAQSKSTDEAPRPVPGSPASVPPGAKRLEVADFDREWEQPEVLTPAAPAQVAPAPVAPSGPLTVSVEALVPHRNQPRQTFEAASIGQLAASIARSGVVQPLVVRRIGPTVAPDGQSERFEIIAGERRWRAAKAAGLRDVPVVVKEIDDEAAMELALVENIQREDLNAIDRSGAYLAYSKQFALTPEEIARRLGEDRTTVVNYLRLQELPDEVKNLVQCGTLSMGHARAILSFQGHAVRVQVARRAVGEGLSVRAIEELARKSREAETRPAADRQAGAKPRSAHVADLEERLQQAVGTRVRIQPGRTKETGKITIEYYSLDDFDRITGRLGLKSE
jgi:ParB family transcriptional regulator, chromosome partitioning protein